MSGRQNSGRGLPTSIIKKIFELEAAHPLISKTEIARRVGINRKSVSKYLEAGRVPTQPAQARVPEMDGEYNLEASFMASLGLINLTKRHFIRLAEEGSLPNQVTPGMIKKLVEAEATITRLPGELSKTRRSLYDQIHDRNLRADKNDVSDLATAGDLENPAT